MEFGYYVCGKLKCCFFLSWQCLRLLLYWPTLTTSLYHSQLPTFFFDDNFCLKTFNLTSFAGNIILKVRHYYLMTVFNAISCQATWFSLFISFCISTWSTSIVLLFNATFMQQVHRIIYEITLYYIETILFKRKKQVFYCLLR